MENLLKLYVPLVGWVSLGWLLGYTLPRSLPLQLGKGLFWVGAPLSIMAFLRQADLSGSVWIAPLVSWVAMLIGISLAWCWVKLMLGTPLKKKPAQGSFLLASMVGNTGYLGYPVALTLVGPQYFGWAVFYDTLGSTLGAYGLGVVLAAYFGMSTPDRRLILQALLQNPAFWSFWVGLALRPIEFPAPIETGLHHLAWAVISLSLVLLGMRLSQIRAWQNIQHACVSIGIKMLIVPLIVGLSLSALGMTGAPLLIVVLQMAMPPAFATLVIAEAYDLDRDLTVTTLAIGSIALLAFIPLWLWLFATP